MLAPGTRACWQCVTAFLLMLHLVLIIFHLKSPWSLDLWKMEKHTMNIGNLMQCYWKREMDNIMQHDGKILKKSGNCVALREAFNWCLRNVSIFLTELRCSLIFFFPFHKGIRITHVGFNVVFLHCAICLVFFYVIRHKSRKSLRAGTVPYWLTHFLKCKFKRFGCKPCQ